MPDTKDQIARLVQAAEEAAYRRGWEDACAALKETVDAVKANYFNPPTNAEMSETVKVTPHHGRTGRPASVAINVVEDCINRAPGMKGVEVVNAAQHIDASIPERTVRTALRRLKIDKKIWQRNKQWYPKSRGLPIDMTEKEEATRSPPQ